MRSNTFPEIGTIVKIDVESNSPNRREPELTKQISKSTGSGFIVNLKQFAKEENISTEFERSGLPELVVITNAHVVAYATNITVRVVGSEIKERFQFTPDQNEERIGHDCDLAMIFNIIEPSENEKEEKGSSEQSKLQYFHHSVQPVQFAKELPLSGVTVWARGFPRGSDNLAKTQGEISRYIFANYSHSGVPLLDMEVTAPINPGNSGGVLVDENGLVIAVVHQHTEHSSNQGHAIPLPLLKRYLKDNIIHGRYLGIPGSPITIERMENPTLKKKLKIDIKSQNAQYGTIIKDVSFLFKKEYGDELVKPGDILLKVDSHLVFNDGTVKYHDGTQVSYLVILQQKMIGDCVEFLLLRNGEQKIVSFSLSRKIDGYLKVPILPRQEVPYIYAHGCVFTLLTMSEKHAWVTSSGNMMNALLFQAVSSGEFSGEPKKQNYFPREYAHKEYVTLRIKSRKADGYNHKSPTIVEAINDVPVIGFAHLRELLNQFSTDDTQTMLVIRTLYSQYPDIILPKLSPQEHKANCEAYTIAKSTPPSIERDRENRKNKLNQWANRLLLLSNRAAAKKERDEMESDKAQYGTYTNHT